MSCKPLPLVIDDVENEWDHDFIALSGQLLEATNVISFVERLNQCHFGFAKISAISLIIHDYLGSGCALFAVDPETGMGLKVRRPDCDMPDHEQGHQEIINIIDSEYFLDHYPELSKKPPYHQLKTYCQLPLSSQDQHLGGIEFISREGAAFSESAIRKLKQLAFIITSLLINVLRRERNLKKASELRSERDYNQILVDVTNTVINQDNIEDLLIELSDSLKKYFGIDSVGLKYFSEKLNIFECYSFSKAQKRKVLFSVEGAGENCDEELTVIRQITPVIGSVQGNSGVSGYCVLPLVFRNQAHGVIRLSHQQADYFDTCDLGLLQKIAARTAMTLHSVQGYQKESALPFPRNQVPVNMKIHQHQVFGEIVSQSQVMNQVLEKAAMVADTPCTVLILGETGTGKELIARAIHRLSKRSSREMIKMNCSAVPEGLIESDLFGHEKGAFTGALCKRLGRFERANNSTLFLDEIGDMPLDLQPKMLRVLQENEIERVGSYQLIPVDVRVIAATNCDLLKMVENKQFRSDLYYRLNVFPITLPPLRKRREDIPLLVQHFTAEIARKMNRNITSIPEDTMAQLCSQPWPGNIRELRNVIERAVILTRGQVLHVPFDQFRSEKRKDEQVDLTIRSGDLSTSVETGLMGADSLDKATIIRVLRESNGVVAGPRGAAQRLGIKRTTLLSRMKRLGISAKAFRQAESSIF